MRKISIADCTLKMISTGGTSRLLFREKLSLALCMDKYGADVIELAPVSDIREDSIIYRTICQSVANSTVAVPVGFTAESVQEAAGCVRQAKHSRLQVSLPVSTVLMEYKYRLKEPKMIEKITELVSAARTYSEDVEFQAEDATRCSEAFLIQAATAAKDAGATVITICDDAGLAMPSDIADLVKKVKEATGLAVFVKVSDAISLGVADALAAIQAGADGIKASVTGDTELKMDAFAKAIRTKGDAMGITTSLVMTSIHSDIQSMTRQMTKSKAAEEQTSGISATFIDKESTREDAKTAIQNLGYELSDDDNGKVWDAIQKLLETKSAIASREIEAVVASTAIQVPAAYSLESYVATISNTVNAVSNIILRKDDNRLSGVATGDGPIDASFRAIEAATGFRYELDDFQIQAVTEGKDALGSALVKLRSNGRLYSGTGLSTDICGASIQAYINALNKIVHEERSK